MVQFKCFGLNFGKGNYKDADSESSQLLHGSKESSTKKKGKGKLKKLLKKDGLRLFFLVLFNGIYLYIGGLVFYTLEETPSVVVDHNKHVAVMLKVFQENSIDLEIAKEIGYQKYVSQNISDANLTLISEQFKMIHEELKESEKTSWTITRAVFFASTVITTIGYGNLSPVTTLGRTFCVLYAIIGIPVTLMLLSLVGNILSKYINNMCAIVISAVTKYLYPDYEYDKVDEETEIKAPAWLALSLIGVFLSLDALLFVALEGWSFSKSLYFIFITLTTIGFGDVVPQNDNAIWFNVTLLYIGLAAVSITINLLVANIAAQYRKRKANIKLMKKLDEELQESEEEDDDEKEGDERAFDVNEDDNMKPSDETGL